MKSGIPYKDAQRWAAIWDFRANQGAGPMRPQPVDTPDASAINSQSTGMSPTDPQPVGSYYPQAVDARVKCGTRTLSPDRAPQPEPHCEQGTDMPEHTSDGAG